MARGKAVCARSAAGDHAGCAAGSASEDTGDAGKTVEAITYITTAAHGDFLFRRMRCSEGWCNLNLALKLRCAWRMETVLNINDLSNDSSQLCPLPQPRVSGDNLSKRNPRRLHSASCCIEIRRATDRRGISDPEWESLSVDTATPPQHRAAKCLCASKIFGHPCPPPQANYEVAAIPACHIQRSLGPLCDFCCRSNRWRTRSPRGQGVDRAQRYLCWIRRYYRA